MKTIGISVPNTTLYGLKDKIRFSLCILFATLSFIFTLPPLKLFWFSWIMIAPLLLVVGERSHFWKDLGLGLVVGIIFGAIGLYWLLYYQAWVYLAVLVSHLPFFVLFFGLTGWLFRKYPQNMIIHVLVPPVIWISLGLIYEFTPLGATGTQAFFYQPIEWMQIARWSGMHGVVFLFMLVNSAVAVAFKFRSNRRFIPLTVMVVILFVVFLYGKKVLAQTFPTNHSVALVQHNLPVSKAWWIRNHQTIKNQYRFLTFEAAKQKPELIIFPSFSLPFDSYRDPQFFEELARETNTYLLVSTYIPRIPNQRISDVGQYEMALLYTPEGKLAGADTAVQGPPFRDIKQVMGQESEVLASSIGKLGVLLCFEDSLAPLVKREIKNGAEVLVALSNPGFFNKTFLPEYHLFQDQLRAIETGRWVIRVSANGYSAIIDPRGRVIKRTELGQQAILYGQVGIIQNK